MAGQKKKVDPLPYLTQFQPLIPQQLTTIFGGGNDISKSFVSQVGFPEAGQVFIVDCAVFGRYDAHRWVSYHSHDGLGPLVHPGTYAPIQDKLEVRYHKKLGKNGKMEEGAIRIIYKMPTKPNAPNKSMVAAVQYLTKLPEEVEEYIKQEKLQVENQVKELEETLQKERAVELAEKEGQETSTAQSSFGRKRKPNSRYSDFFDPYEAAAKAAKIQTDEVKYEEEEDEDDEDYDEEKEQETSPKSKQKTVKQNKGRGSGLEHGGRVWMAGYGLEKTKPKSSLLFRMCSENEEMVSEGDDAGHHQSDENDAGQVLYYSIDKPSPVMLAERMLNAPEVSEVIDVVLEGKMRVCTSTAGLPKPGDLFVIKADLVMEDGEEEIESGTLDESLGLIYTRYQRSLASQICDVASSLPEVKIVYQSKSYPQFQLVHYLTADQINESPLKQVTQSPSILVMSQNTPSPSKPHKVHTIDSNNLAPFRLTPKSLKRELEDDESGEDRTDNKRVASKEDARTGVRIIDHSKIKSEEGDKSLDTDNTVEGERDKEENTGEINTKGEEVQEKKAKHPGRPRIRVLTDLDENVAENEEEGRRKEFDEDEPRPFKIFSGEKLHLADGEELFKKAKRDGLKVYKSKVKKPQCGDIYLLDKQFVPYSDSLAWVRDYYNKCPPTLLERFFLRDPTSPHNYPLAPAAKTVFTQCQSTGNDTTLCIVHYQKEMGKKGTRGSNVMSKMTRKKKKELHPGVFTESNSNLKLSTVASMLTNPDHTRVIQAPILNPLPFQVYLLQLPPDKDSKVVDNYRWTDKGFKRWPPGVPTNETKLICYHCPMKVTRGAMCTALMRHEFRHTSASPHLRVIHYMPTREFREYIVITNAAAMMQTATQLSRELWENMEAETENPIHVSSTRLKPSLAWELLSRETSTALHSISTSSTIDTVSTRAMEIITPQPGGVYLSRKYEAPDLLRWEELGKLQIQPRLYQLVEVCDRVHEDDNHPSYLVRLSYTSPKVPHRILVHYLGDTRPYLIRECQVVIDGYSGEPYYKVKGKRHKRSSSLARDYSLQEERLYHISASQLREAGSCPVKLGDLDIDIETEAKTAEEKELESHLIRPDKPGLYRYGYRILNKRITELLETMDRDQVTHLPIKTPEAGEAYLVSKPSSSKVWIDPYKWTQKGWQPYPRKSPQMLWRWGLMRHRRQIWAPPLIRIEYVHTSVNSDLMLVHYLPTKDNQNMLEIRSAILPMRTQTHTLLSLGDVNFGQHSQLLTNSPLPPSHIWELLNAGGGLTQPLSLPQPGGVYVTNLDEKESLDWMRWESLGSLRLSSADYCLMETTSVIDWLPSGLLARLTYHSPLIKNRTVMHYLGDSRPYTEKAKEEEAKQQRKMETLRRIAGDSSENLEIECLEIDDTQLSLPDITASRDAATEAVGSVLVGLGSSAMDSDTLNNTFAELGGEVEGLCEGEVNQIAWRRLEDDHLRDANLPPIEVPFGSFNTSTIVSQLFPEGLPMIRTRKVFEVGSGEGVDRKDRFDTVLDMQDVKGEPKEEERVITDPYRAVPRNILDWNEDNDEREETVEETDHHQSQQARLHITTTEPRTIIYLKQQDALTEKQVDHLLCNPDVSRISFVPLIEPQAGEVYVVAIPYRKGETRRMDCYSWYITGHKKGKYRRTYSYIREQDGNTSHRLMRYTYDFAWEDKPGLRVVHYIQGNPKHQVQCSGKKPNFEEECENQGEGPMYCAYTASMTHRDVLLILADPPLYHVCELPIKDPKAGDVYIVKAPAAPLAKQELLYDTLSWSEGQMKQLGGKRAVVRKTKYLSMDPEDGTKSDAFVRVTWVRLVDLKATNSELPTATSRNQPYIIIHYLGDDSMGGEMVRKGKDGALHLRQIRHYMETGYYLPSVHINEKNGIRKSAKKFVLEDKTMYYIGKTGKEKRLVLYTNEEKNKVFHECHVMSKTGEHCGRTKTLRRLTERYYWTCMVEDIVALIVRCKTCEFSKMNKSNQRFVRVTEPWEIVSVDIMGQFVSSEQGHVFLAVIIDMLTKYTVVVPLRDTTTADMTRALQTAVYQQGPPRKFVSDQHQEFIKELNIALEVDSGLVGNVMSVTKCQMNRPDEAAIKTSLLHHCLQAGPLWDQGLQRKVYELNTSYTTGSGQTPFYLMFHRQPRPMDVIFNLQMGNSIKPNFVVRDIERYMEERKRIATDILSQAVSGQCRPDSVSVVAGEAGVVLGDDVVVSEQCDVDGVSARDLLEAVTSAGQASVQVLTDMEVDGEVGGSVHVVANMGGMTGVDQDHAHYTPLLHHSQVVDEGGGSVYEMGDGEGQVVVVANGLPGLEDSGGSGGGREGMVVVQPGGGEGPGSTGGGEGIIMLAESHQVIMEAVDGHQFTYVPHT